MSKINGSANINVSAENPALSLNSPLAKNKKMDMNSREIGNYIKFVFKEENIQQILKFMGKKHKTQQMQKSIFMYE